MDSDLSANPTSIIDDPSTRNPRPSDSLLDSLFETGGFAETVPIAVVAIDPCMRVVGWNRAASEMFGWNADEMVGTNHWLELIPASARRRVLEIFERIGLSESHARSINENLTKDGRRILCEWDNVAIKDASGKPRMFIALARDVTAQNRAEVEQARLRDIAALANAARNRSEILLLIRNAVLDVGGFDRAGVWLHEDGRLRGSYGTDMEGALRDEHELLIDSTSFSSELRSVIQRNRPYAISGKSLMPMHRGADISLTKETVFAVIGLFAHSRLIGVVFFDNLPSGRKITDADTTALLPFCEQAAIALSNAQLLEERARMIERQQRLMEISAAINHSLNLDEVLHLVRSAIVSAGGFERAGVFRVEDDTILGSWGTDTTGREVDERSFRTTLESANPLIRSLIVSGERYVLEDARVEFPDDSPAGMIRRAVIALRAGGEFVGLISVDNLLSGRPATEESVEALLPFCEQAAVAIRNANLMMERKRMLERQRRFATIAAAISAKSGLHEILRLVRDALVEVGAFDRATIWLCDSERPVLRGAWGTDRQGRAIDISGDVEPISRDSELPIVKAARDPVAYVLTADYTAAWRLDPADPSFGIRAHAAVPLRAGDRTLGVICVDNIVRDVPITEQNVDELLPFAEQSAVAIANAYLVQEREQTLRRQQRLMDISAAINRSAGLDDLLLLVRDAVKDTGLFDRVGVWTLQEGSVCGAWGTDCDGILRDERGIRAPYESWGGQIVSLTSGEIDFYIEDWTPTDTISGQIPAFVPHAVVGLRTSGELVGLLSVDNLRSNRPIGTADLKTILPFVEQAAVAIRNAQLTVERERLIQRQRRLAEFSAAISGRSEPNEIFRMVRDAIVEAAGFDRAGVLLWDRDRRKLVGTWGTDRDGRPEDISGVVQPMQELSDSPVSRIVRGEVDSVLTPDLEAAFPSESTSPVHGVRAHAAVAMRAAGEIVGVISVDNLVTDRPITPDEVILLLPFAEQAAVAIHNAMLLEERKLLEERQRTLASISAAIMAHTDLNDILRMLRDAAVDTAGFDRAGVFLYDKDAETLSGTWGTDLDGNPEDISNEILELTAPGSRQIKALLFGPKPFIISKDYAREYGLPRDHPMGTVRCQAAVRLTSDDEILGFISVDNAVTDRSITMREVAVLLPFAHQAAVAIQNARLFDQLKQAQEALVRSERLRALGELASGVAHNINNLLTAVLGYSELIQQEPEVPATIAHYARIIERAGLDGAEIVRRVRQFAQNEIATPTERYDIAQILRQAIDLTRPLWRTQAEAGGAAIDIVTEIPQRLDSVGIATEIREVIVNLIKNAFEAMENGGVLTIRCKQVDTNAEIEIEDTGTGMDEAVCKRVFEPFFTTKGAAIGTGLGLSLAWGIVRRHNGRIDVTSVPGEGSCFRIRLPLAKPEPVETIQSTESKLPLLNGVRILLVEDEEVVAESLARILISRGASVALAESGEEALMWLQAHSGICDIVLSDHGMPGMSGLEMLARIRKDYPALHRVLLSGWGESPPGATDTTAAERVLSKPIRQRDLLKALREVSDGDT